MAKQLGLGAYFPGVPAVVQDEEGVIVVQSKGVGSEGGCDRPKNKVKMHTKARAASQPKAKAKAKGGAGKEPE